MFKTLFLTLSVLFLFSFNQLFSQANAGPDQEICTDSTYMQANNPVPNAGQWSIIGSPGTPVFENASLYNTKVINLAIGSNTFRWTVNIAGDEYSDIVTITNNLFDANAGLDQTLDPLDTDTYFEAVLPENCIGQWSILSGSGNIFSDTSPTSYVYNMPTGENVFTWHVHNNLTGCNDSDDVSIIVNNSFPPPLEDQLVCIDTAKLNARVETGASSQTWSVISGTGLFDDIHDANTVVRNISLGENIYRWTINFIGYFTEVDCTVYYDSIFASAGEDAVLCNGEYTMNAQQINNTDSTWWSPVGLGGGTIVNNTAWNTLVTDITPGDNYFEWYVSNGHCASRDTVKITYNLPPIAQFETDLTEFCTTETVTIQNTSTQYGGYSPPDEFQRIIGDLIMPNTFDINGSFEYNFTNTAIWDSVYQIRLVAVDYETMCTDTFYSNVLALASPNSRFCRKS